MGNLVPMLSMLESRIFPYQQLYWILLVLENKVDEKLNNPKVEIYLYPQENWNYIKSSRFNVSGMMKIIVVCLIEIFTVRMSQKCIAWIVTFIVARLTTVIPSYTSHSCIKQCVYAYINYTKLLIVLNLTTTTVLIKDLMRNFCILQSDPPGSVDEDLTWNYSALSACERD